ncbi:MAG: hypothetical protein EXR71_11175 [Myxococcales bacterium]|nr:hypothetical protein [Myxococcales bacterium]
MILSIDKPAGWTPLEALDDLRARTLALAGEKLVYAGRLDPMAEGLLLVLTGQDRFALAEHLAHDKEYVATVLFGVGSDTHDALGRLIEGSAPTLDACAAAVAALAGTHELPLPVWSSYRVKGRALHAWARASRLDEIAIPRRTMTVTAIATGEARQTRVAEVLPGIRARIERVRGEFRQPEALADWFRLAQSDPPLVLCRATLSVNSGSYVRALAHDLGVRLGCGALLLTLRRTRVGPFTLPS